MLTPAQINTLATYITSQPDLNTLPLNADGYFEIARLLNLSSAFIVYKTFVSQKDLTDAFIWSEVANLTSLNNTRLQTIGIFAPRGINPSRADVRTFFGDVFSGAVGVQTTSNLTALWRRPARRGESIFATGTGTSNSPGTLVFEGFIAPSEVEDARTA